MIKESIEEDMTVIKVYIFKNSAPKIHEPKTNRRKEEMLNSPIRNGDFKTSLSIIEKINREWAKM